MKPVAPLLKLDLYLLLMAAATGVRMRSASIADIVRSTQLLQAAGRCKPLVDVGRVVNRYPCGQCFSRSGMGDLTSLYRTTLFRVITKAPAALRSTLRRIAALPSIRSEL